MSQLVYTFCDYCNPLAIQRPDINDPGRGWAEWPEDHCVQELGWELYSYDPKTKIMCPDCQEEGITS